MPGRQFWIGLSITLFFPVCVHYLANAIHPYPEFHYQLRVVARLAPSTPEGWRAWDEENQAEEKRRQEELDYIDQAKRPFFRTLILVGAPLGIAAILVGSYVGITSVATGLIAGGIITVFYAYCGYWSHLDPWFRLASVLLAVAMTIFVWQRRFTARSTPT